MLQVAYSTDVFNAPLLDDCYAYGLSKAQSWHSSSFSFWSFSVTFCLLLVQSTRVSYFFSGLHCTSQPFSWAQYYSAIVTNPLGYNHWCNLQDFCYYANTFLLVMILFYPKDEKLFMVCFSFAEVWKGFLWVACFLVRAYNMCVIICFFIISLQGPLAWALIVWRCSLVFSSFDKLVSVLIHLLPGTLSHLNSPIQCIGWWETLLFLGKHHLSLVKLFNYCVWCLLKLYDTHVIYGSLTMTTLLPCYAKGSLSISCSRYEQFN